MPELVRQHRREQQTQFQRLKLELKRRLVPPAEKLERRIDEERPMNDNRDPEPPPERNALLEKIHKPSVLESAGL
ncbi:MAG TPA: hypothetical protein VM008_06075 [Phycisphaerae bacterium]|nr:hypothetical protein [Phycisphaerae bacterium]